MGGRGVWAAHGDLLGGIAAVVAFVIGLVWLLRSGRLHRHETRRFALAIDETTPIAVVPPEEFSDEIAATTPIRLPDAGEGAHRKAG